MKHTSVLPKSTTPAATKRSPRVTRSSDDEAAHARERILAEAARLFQTKGYEQTTVRDVVARSRSSNATLVKYFGGKNGLFTAYVIEYGNQLANIARIEDTSDPEATLVEIGRRILTYFLPNVLTYRASIGAITNHAKVGEIVFQNIHDRLVRLIAGYLKEWAKEGKIQASDFEADAERFFQLVKAGIWLRVMYGIQSVSSESDIDAATRGAARTFLYGIASPTLRY